MFIRSTRPSLRFVVDGGAPEGASGSAQQPAQQLGQQAQQQGQQAQQQPQPPVPAPPAVQQQQAAPSQLEQLSKDDLLAEVERLRRESANRRVAARDANELVEAFAQALGIAPKEQTPEQMRAALAEHQQQVAQLQQAVETLNGDLTGQARVNAVLRIAPSVGADGSRLVDSRSFTDKLATVDPSDEAAITAAIKQAVEADSTFALARAAGSSGGFAAQGDGQTPAPKSLTDAIARRMGSNK